MRYVGEGWVVDGDEFVVERLGERVDLEPQAFDVVVFLLERRESLVTKEELLDGVWGDQFVSESALTTRIKQVRRALGDDGRTQRLIKTVHGRGYRFVGAVEEEAEGAVPSPSASPPSGAPSHNIAPARNRLIGREATIDLVAGHTGRERLTTLVGLGGMGKTTVAREVGRRVGASRPAGAWFVDLVPVHDGAELRATVASAIGVQLRDGTTEELVAKLSGRDLLLILDNCEHLIDEVAELIDAVLDHTDLPSVLATSRVPLGIRGEHRVTIPPLPVSHPDGGAVDLLNEVARRRGATIDDHDQAMVVDLCSRLDGLPLALELIGAHLGAMSLADVLDRVDRLVGRASGHGFPNRHASLEAVLDDATADLSEAERILLAALARVEGVIGFVDMERLAMHCEIPDSLDAIEGLVDRSLMVAADGPGTHRMLETVREHARSHDQDEQRSRATHAAWCLDVVGPGWQHHFTDMTLASWATERYGDLVVAERYLRESGRSSDAAHLLAACGLTMHFDPGSRSGRWLDLIDAHLADEDDPVLRARLHATGVMAGMSSRRHLEMFQHGQDAVAAADQSDDAALQALARVTRTWAGVVVDIDGALRDIDEAIDLARAAPSEQMEMMAMGFKVFHLAMAARFDEATTLARAAYGEGFSHPTYPARVITQGLICCLVIEDPPRALEVDASARTGIIRHGMWGMDVVRACVLAASGSAGGAGEEALAIAGQLEREGLNPLPDLLLVPAVLAFARGETGRASRYLGAIRHADGPTQNLMVSTTYRVVRSHVDPAPATEVGGRTEEIWAEARNWLQDQVTDAVTQTSSLTSR